MCYVPICLSIYPCGLQYFRKLNTAISVVYVETWHQNNHLGVDRVDDLRQTLVRLTDYYGMVMSRAMYKTFSNTTTPFPISAVPLLPATTVVVVQNNGVVALDKKYDTFFNIYDQCFMELFMEIPVSRNFGQTFFFENDGARKVKNVPKYAHLVVTILLAKQCHHE